MDGTEAGEERQSGALKAVLERARSGAPAPAERWQPPYCGDIGLDIRADGTWLYRGSAILREALVRLFASVLCRDADGRTYLVTPTEKVDVAVEDAPFLAVEMEVQGKGRRQTLILRTNVDDIVHCGPMHPLRFAEQDPGGGLKPYVLVRGRLEALLTRPLVYELAELAMEEERDGKRAAGVWSGGAFFPFLSAP